MSNLPNINLPKKRLSLGAIPTSYLVSLSYEEQLFEIGKKTDEIISFINDILEEKINEYINNKFNEIMLNSLYIQETETLVLYLENGGN